jgi:hypothetical protein
MSVKIAGVPAEIRTEHLSITCLKRYPYDHPLDNDCSLRIKMQTQFLFLNSVCNWDFADQRRLLGRYSSLADYKLRSFFLCNWDAVNEQATISLIKYFCVQCVSITGVSVDLLNVINSS